MKDNKVLVLYYHRINSLNIDTNLLAVSPEQFRQHMKFLKRNYIIPRFEEDWSMLDGPGVVITFDDGYLDVYQNALPILEDLGIPATVFVCTGTMNQKREMWWDELENLILVGNDIPQRFHLVDEVFDYTWSTDTYEMRLNCYQSIHFLMKNCINVEKRNEWFEQLWNWRQKQPMARQTHLTVGDNTCIELAKSNLITIGGHTVSHPALAKLDVNEQKREIGLSLRYLARLLSREINVFSYPFGGARVDYNDDTINICRELGVVKAATTKTGIWLKEKGDYTIPRNCVKNINLFEFEKMINMLWEA